MDKSLQNSDISKAAQMIKESNYTIVLTGAGMSTESGIPDFRSKDGWWRKINPSTVANINALESNYEFFREFYIARIQSLGEAKSHIGHKLLAEWEEKGLINAIITQNVDGLHPSAGSKAVYEIHGSIQKIHCYDCGVKSTTESFINEEKCHVCGGRLRPGVVLFGESLPSQTLDDAIKEARKADLIIVIGTSLTVGPVNRLPFLSPCKRIIINAEKTDFDSEFDIVIRGKAGEILSELNQILC
jgi:NAD-dependent deacetylase